MWPTTTESNTLWLPTWRTSSAGRTNSDCQCIRFIHDVLHVNIGPIFTFTYTVMYIMGHSCLHLLPSCSEEFVSGGCEYQPQKLKKPVDASLVTLRLLRPYHIIIILRYYKCDYYYFTRDRVYRRFSSYSPAGGVLRWSVGEYWTSERTHEHFIRPSGDEYRTSVWPGHRSVHITCQRYLPVQRRHIGPGQAEGMPRDCWQLREFIIFMSLWHWARFSKETCSF